MRKFTNADELLIKNDGLRLAMEFGPNWLKPIESRLSKIYPNLSKETLSYYNTTCQKAMLHGHKIAYQFAEKHGENITLEDFKLIIVEKHDWISDNNIEHLYSQSLYYVYKDFGF